MAYMPFLRGLHARYGLHADSLLVIDDAVAYTFMVGGPMFKTSRQFSIHQTLRLRIHHTIGLGDTSNPFVSAPSRDHVLGSPRRCRLSTVPFLWAVRRLRLVPCVHDIGLVWPLPSPRVSLHLTSGAHGQRARSINPLAVIYGGGT
jgi:hypothetical protein